MLLSRESWFKQRQPTPWSFLQPHTTQPNTTVPSQTYSGTGPQRLSISSLHVLQLIVPKDWWFSHRLRGEARFLFLGRSELPISYDSPREEQGYEPSHTTTGNAACTGAQDQGFIAWVTSKPPSITLALTQASSHTGKHREGFPWKAEVSPSHEHNSAKNPCSSCCTDLRSQEICPSVTWSSPVV